MNYRIALLIIHLLFGFIAISTNANNDDSVERYMSDSVDSSHEYAQFEYWRRKHGGATESNYWKSKEEAREDKDKSNIEYHHKDVSDSYEKWNKYRKVNSDEEDERSKHNEYHRHHRKSRSEEKYQQTTKEAGIVVESPTTTTPHQKSESVEYQKSKNKSVSYNNRKLNTSKSVKEEKYNDRRSSSHQMEHDSYRHRVGRRPILPADWFFPFDRSARGELRFDTADYESIYRFYELRRWINLFDGIESKLYSQLGRVRQRHLHAMAQLFTNDHKYKLFKMLKKGRFDYALGFIKKRLDKQPKDQRFRFYDSLGKLFGRDLEPCPTPDSHVYEAQIITVGIIFIVW